MRVYDIEKRSYPYSQPSELKLTDIHIKTVIETTRYTYTIKEAIILKIINLSVYLATNYIIPFVIAGHLPNLWKNERQDSYIKGCV